jgi:membrane protease YdiL (CAAX protease family)
VTGDIKPWGRIATFLLAFVAMLAGQLGALAVLAWWYGFSLGELPDISGDGVAVALIIFISTPIQVLLLALFASRAGGSVAEYLGLVWPRRSEVVFGVAAVVVGIVVLNIISSLLGRNIVTPFQNDIYRTASAAGWLPWIWLWVAVTVVTPIGEESVFRGFLFRGWLRSPKTIWPTIVATALVWALIHVQYDWFVTGQVFAFGLLLGWMRWATGSTILTMLMHGLINLEGMLETFVNLQWPS